MPYLLGLGAAVALILALSSTSPSGPENPLRRKLGGLTGSIRGSGGSVIMPTRPGADIGGFAWPPAWLAGGGDPHNPLKVASSFAPNSSFSPGTFVSDVPVVRDVVQSAPTPSPAPTPAQTPAQSPAPRPAPPIAPPPITAVSTPMIAAPTTSDAFFAPTPPALDLAAMQVKPTPLTTSGFPVTGVPSPGGGGVLDPGAMQVKPTPLTTSGFPVTGVPSPGGGGVLDPGAVFVPPSVKTYTAPIYEPAIVATGLKGPGGGLGYPSAEPPIVASGLKTPGGGLAYPAPPQPTYSRPTPVPLPIPQVTTAPFTYSPSGPYLDPGPRATVAPAPIPSNLVKNAAGQWVTPEQLTSRYSAPTNALTSGNPSEAAWFSPTPAPYFAPTPNPVAPPAPPPGGGGVLTPY